MKCDNMDYENGIDSRYTMVTISYLCFPCFTGERHKVLFIYTSLICTQREAFPLNRIPIRFILSECDQAMSMLESTKE